MQREREKEERAAEGKEGWSLTDQQEDEREKRPPKNPKSTGSPPGPTSSIRCRKRPQQLWLLEKRQAAIKLMRYYPRRRNIRIFILLFLELFKTPPCGQSTKHELLQLFQMSLEELS